jgi:predicted kinase
MFFIQMSGFPGSGKSTLALEIANQTGCIIIDHDISKSAMLDCADEGLIEGEVAGKISYNIDFSLVDYYLSQGRSVILDSPCLFEEMIEKGTRISCKHNAEYKYIECYLDDFVEINNRLRNRERMISQISEVTSEEAFFITLENSKKPTNFTYLIVNTKDPLDTYFNDVMDYINS